MKSPQRVRRPGYAPTNPAVGRRGMHTREQIVAHAGALFVEHGYHGTSIDAIAKAVGGSRATIYQYFESKDDIFRELVRQCEPAVLEHATRLGRLGPDADGVRSLHRWLTEWAQLYDKYAMVFLEFPGVGAIEGLPQTEAGAVSGQYADLITRKLRDAGIRGIEAADAAAALLRIAHMVNLYRFRGMFGLRSAARTTDSLTVTMQLLLFPETPADYIAEIISVPTEAAVVRDEPTAPAFGLPKEPDAFSVSPIRQDVLSASSVLFNERGYYSVAMEDIAAAASVSRATLYRHFSTKVKILEELTGWSVLEGAHLAAQLHELARSGIDVGTLHSWLGRYVHFHRSYSGVIRAWYDGTLAQQLAGDAVVRGMGGFHVAVSALLDGVRLPAGIDRRVAAAVFLSVLGRMTELSISRRRNVSDYEAASLMLLVLQRALLGDLEPRDGTVHPSPRPRSH
ncbi:TetR/AcrR family transcriptional regulator [Mycobacterium sp. HUMS_1102779]|uniref:TetR/AcrR family transcriptional regulator n=1 Tax=Mycobacterium sp. HUMS_1102779 TaxID=3383487 RepID=UPI003899D7DC